MKASSTTTANGTGFSENSVTPSKDDNPESLKKILQNPNASMPDTMEALAKLFQMDGVKVANGTASDEEKTRYYFNEDLRSGRISDSDRDLFASQLGMSADRLAEVQKQFGHGGGGNGGSGI